MPSFILHLGVGSFHRAHQAFYLHRLRQLEVEGGDASASWYLAAGQIRPDMNTTMTSLAAQNGKYTLETVNPRGERTYTRIESIKRIIAWTEENEELIAAAAETDCKIISFTVTVSGYYLDEHDNLNMENPDLASDLLRGSKKTIYGTIAAILAARRKNASGAVTLLSCDNVRSNGDRFRAGLARFLIARSDGDLLKWMNDNTTCPNSMVDRITPTPTSCIRERVLEALSVEDAVPVMCEQFTQWVIEDRFAAGRPVLESVGVEMVDSVLPYVEAKIRVLNASHSCIVWGGSLLNLKYIHESVRQAEIRQFANSYITEDVIPCLSPSPIDLEHYRDCVLNRIANPYILDTNERVAADGFSKIPGFIMPTITQCLQKAHLPRATAVLLALFFRFLERWHRGTLSYMYRDDAMKAARVHGYFETGDSFGAFMNDQQLFGELAGDPRLANTVREALETIDDWLAKHA